tara:strand:- start:2604 stop:3275 length:672 start_codon:yes stop_codon:yes gene_type:complete
MYLIIKRICDFTLAVILLVIISPLLIPITIGLSLTGEGYIWYKQERIGLKNKPFQIWKFATMLKNSPNMAGGIMTTKKDPRITPMGGFLRKTKINEIPQLLNILFGDMSFVGPRPIMLQSFKAYPKYVQDIIYEVKPGLTGIGSIIFRDEEELLTKIKNSGMDPWEFYKNTIAPYKGSVENWFQNNQSFWVECKIIVLTALVIIKPNSQLVYIFFKDLPKRNF